MSSTPCDERYAGCGLAKVALPTPMLFLVLLLRWAAFLPFGFGLRIGNRFNPERWYSGLNRSCQAWRRFLSSRQRNERHSHIGHDSGGRRRLDGSTERYDRPDHRPRSWTRRGRGNRRRPWAWNG